MEGWIDSFCCERMMRNMEAWCNAVKRPMKRSMGIYNAQRQINGKPTLKDMGKRGQHRVGLLVSLV